MSIRNLDALFRPASIAVVGASNRPGSVGSVVMRNLLGAGFEGPIMPVNPGRRAVAGVLAYRDVAALPEPPDLGVVCTPAATVPGIVGDLGRRGARAVVVLTAGFSESGREGAGLSRSLLEAARPGCTRILGPNCVGLMVPGSSLNASFAHTNPLRGNLAFVSQSGALCTAVLDRACSRGIGFSHFVSLGNGLDVDFGDVLDYLGSDAGTRAILLYVESVVESRKFMSAARAAARNKPVLVVKSGRFEEGARAAASHTGALAGSDPVYDAAFRRAGMLRVHETEELFDAVETLARARRVRGGRLAILTNGGGPGVLATDALVARGGRLAGLSDETLSALDAVLPPTWPRGNPVDVIGDASADRYAAALEILCRDPGVDALLVMHVPTAVVSSDDVARAAIAAAGRVRRPVLTCWLGGAAVERARAMFADARIPTYGTPDQAVAAMLHVVHYQENQELLMETPPSTVDHDAPDRERARRIVAQALEEGTRILGEVESKDLLGAYGIPVVATRAAATPEEAARVASELGLPVALKVRSPDVTHKSDVGGVVLDLRSEEAVRSAAAAMRERLRAARPEARLEGFSVQRMVPKGDTEELIVGVSTDPVFGPVVVFGQGGTAVEVVRDRALALPPLNAVLARDLVSRTRVARLLAGYRHRRPADMDALHDVLVRVSQLVVDVPELAEMDVNPLLAGPDGAVALDARVVVEAPPPGERLAIRPYPRELEETAALANGRRVLLRPIRPEDEPAHQAFFARLTPEDVRFRFFDLVREFSHTQMARFTQIDYDREMAFLATDRDEEGRSETLGVVRAVTEADERRAEFAIIVRSDQKGLGLGRILLEKMIRYCRERGTAELVGQVRPDNTAMLELARRLGFRSRRVPGEDLVEVTFDLTT